MNPQSRLSERELEINKDILLSYVSNSAIGQAVVNSIFQHIEVVEAENEGLIRIQSGQQRKFGEVFEKQQAELTTLRAENRELRDLIVAYGGHAPICRTQSMEGCDCGYKEGIKKVAALGSKEEAK